MAWNYDMVYLGEVKVLAKWQVVIPKEIRHKLSIHPWETLNILLREDGAISIMRTEDLKKAIQTFNHMDFSKQENIDAIKEMQSKMDQIIDHFRIEE